MRVLISGAGVAGPTLAYWLVHYGFEPTIVESAPHFRSGGYVIDFWGAGFEVAARMGLLDELRRKGYAVRELGVVNGSGKRIAGFSTESLASITGGRFTSLPRGDLAETIFAAIEGRVETLFGDSVDSLEAGSDGVEVTFSHAGRRSFDLVIGADGLHSRIRQLVFGPESQFEKYLGYKAAAFEVADYMPRDELTYVMYTEVHQQIARFALRNGRTMFLLTFKDDEFAIPGDIQRQKAVLRRRFENSGWECPRILNALDHCGELYFDRVSQIRMESWSRGRVALVGDAASCVSLLAGQGSALAMVGAYLLAAELDGAGGDYQLAFARYQQRFGPFVSSKQKAALRFAGFFAPNSRLALLVRNQVIRLMSIPGVAGLALGRDLVDRIDLPQA